MAGALSVDVIDKLANMTGRVPTAEVEVDGRKHWRELDGTLKEMKPPVPAYFSLNTLAGLVGFLKDYRAHNDAEMPLLVQVSTPTVVRAYENIEKIWQRRPCVAEVTAINTVFPFSQNLALDKFIIAIQANFVQDENTKALLAIVSSIKDETGITVDDDGYTQRVTTKRGLTLAEDTKVPNPIILQPYRTFLEVDQPKSAYVFRMESGGGEIRASLHTAEGGQWKLLAMANVGKWLEKNLRGVGTISLIQ